MNKNRDSIPFIHQIDHPTRGFHERTNTSIRSVEYGSEKSRITKTMIIWAEICKNREEGCNTNFLEEGMALPQGNKHQTRLETLLQQCTKKITQFLKYTA